jgi:hypothetical protein
MPAQPEPRTSPRRVGIAERRAKAARLRAQGLTYEQIARQCGHRSASNAVQDVQRYLVDTAREATDEVRAIEVARLDQILYELAQTQIEVMKILQRRHVVVSNGRVVSDRDGIDLIDDGVSLNAIAQLLAIQDRRLKVQDRRARLLGLDAPTKHEVVTLDAVDAEIQRLNAEIARTADLERIEALQAAETQRASE